MANPYCSSHWLQYRHPTSMPVLWYSHPNLDINPNRNSTMTKTYLCSVKCATRPFFQCCDVIYVAACGQC